MVLKNLLNHTTTKKTSKIIIKSRFTCKMSLNRQNGIAVINLTSAIQLSENEKILIK